MNRRHAVLGGLAVALGGGALWYSTRPIQSTGSGLASASAQNAAEADMSMIAEMSIGNSDAKVTVVEYASFTCPHCRTFHSGTLPEIKENYIDTGKINFIFREVYFDRFGLWAGMVARCGGEDRYFGLVDLIFANQSEWLAGGDPALVADNLRKLGKTAGLNDQQLDDCLNDGEMAQALVAVFQKNSTEDNINSTPSFMINGEQYGNMNYRDFANILDEKLGE